MLAGPREDALEHLAEGVAPGEHHGAGGAALRKAVAVDSAGEQRLEAGAAWLTRAGVVVDGRRGRLALLPPPPAQRDDRRERTGGRDEAGPVARARLLLRCDLVVVPSTSCRSPERRSACTSSFGVSNEMSADPSAASLSYCAGERDLDVLLALLRERHVHLLDDATAHVG